MHPLRRLGRITAVAISALTLTGCASMRVSSYVDRGTDFTRYRTYNWASSDRLSTGDPRLDNNPFFHERVQKAVDEQLASRGFEKMTSGTPDLVLHYHASVNQKLDVSEADQKSGYATPPVGSGTRGETSEPYVYDAGTLLIDFVDARSNKLVWRGWAESSLDGVIDDQAWLEETVDKAVAKVLERLPRRL